MMYNFITNRHFKVWLGPLSLQNELRLRNLRALNPESELSLVYDKRLLSGSEEEVILSLCSELGIELFDVETDIAPNLTTPEELDLLADYNQAIKTEELGGNLAAASDIIRWLGPVYELGTYSDLDVLIDSKNLPSVIQVKSPLLLNIGSISQLGVESPSVNNDILAVVDNEAALLRIQQIQRTIHEGCRYYEQGENAFSNIQDAFSKKPIHPNSSFVGRWLTGALPINDELTYIADGKSIGQVRSEIFSITNDSNSFYEHYPWRWWYYKISSLGSGDKFNSKITEFSSSLLKESVIYTTGPGATLVSISEHPTYPNDFFDKELAPMSFEYYGLNKHFQSGNGLVLHSGYKELLQLFSKKRNDLSWLEDGREHIQNHELALANLSANVSASHEIEVTEKIGIKDNTDYSIEEVMINESGATAEFERMAKQHMQQLAEMQNLLNMNTQCDEEKHIGFKSCSRVEDASICVQTNVKMKTPTFFSRGNTFPNDIEYICKTELSENPRLICTTEIETELCDSNISGLSANIELIRRLGAATNSSAFLAAAPEAVGDALRLIANVSSSDAATASEITRTIILALTGSWFALTINGLSTMSAQCFGVSKSSATLIGNALAITLSLSEDFNAEALLIIGMSLAAGRFGLWAEKKIAKQLAELKSDDISLRIS